VLYGLGACDSKGGLAATLYGAKLLRDVKLQGDIVVCCVVQTEVCENMGTQILFEEKGLHPDWVVVSQPTDLNISRGQRGRLEMRLTTYGCAAHAACPDLGDNAIYASARLAFGLELLGAQLGNDRFLGPGSLAVTNICSNNNNVNVIPDRCELTIDRRLTLGENETMALAEVQRVIAREGIRAQVQVVECDITSYTGYSYHKRAFYPAWVIPEDHPLVMVAAQAIRVQAKKRPQVGRGEFSSAGVYTAGVAGVPTISLGPGNPHSAHTVDEHISLDDVHTSAEIYAKLAIEMLGV
jgi:putative selenium metabolism hydrolase